MSKVTDSIGDWFEGFIANRYWNLWDTRGDTLRPDFCHATDFGDNKWEEHFWLEAKVGNVQWGCRIKDYQVDSFHRPDKSIVYVLGMHDFDNANARLTQITKGGRRRYLDNNANVLQMNFVTNPFMNLLYQKEKRTSAKNQVEYCMLKPSVLNNLFENREFTRGAKKDEYGKIVTPGVKVMPESFYGFDYQNYRWFEGKQKDGIFLRAILDPDLDVEFIDYLNDREDVDEYFWLRG